MDRRLDPAALERAGDDEPLDLRGSLPDPVDAQLAVEPLGDVGAQIAATTERLDGAVRAAPGGLGDEQLGHRGLGMDELRVGAGIDHLAHVERQQPSHRGVGGRIGERE
jgi:hypothetical protein